LPGQFQFVQVRLIAEARVKMDKIDAAILAQLYASGFLPQVWMPTIARRRFAAKLRAGLRSFAIAHD